MNTSLRLRHVAGRSLVGAALSVLFTLACQAAEVHVLLGVDPADASGDLLLSASLAPSQSLSRSTGSKTT
ncbi:MAG: hypothetical protein ABI641_07965, partial [Caldimonas sp.]